MTRLRNQSCIDAGHLWPGGTLRREDGQGRCLTCREAKNRKVRAEKRAFIDAVKLESGCISCGYRKEASALDLHHTNAAEKEHAAGGTHLGWARIRAEVAKCVVLCANCHRELHAAERGDVSVAVPSDTTETVQP